MNIVYPNEQEILTESFLSKYRGKQPNWGFSGLGLIIFKRTYARTKADGTTEEWYETIERCIRGAQRIGAKYTREEAERLYDYMFNLKCMFSGRGLWQLGTPLADQYMDSLLNCWGCKTANIDDFCFIFMESMFGGGVGCNITKEFSFELPRVKKNTRVRLKNTKDADFIVPDSKEGWCELWRKILESYLITGKTFTYSTICIRPEGEPLKTFGGIAPGPRPLIDGTKLLIELLESREGKKLRTQDVADIICIGGEIVKSGGVRRTAIILCGDPDDIAYLDLKRWDLYNIPFYRSNSNNSIIANYFRYLTDKFWSGYYGNGEAYGIINLRNARRFGRTGETKYGDLDLAEPNIVTPNPCGEALVEDKEPCNLAEIHIHNVSSLDEAKDIAVLLHKTCKAICAGPYYHEASNKVVHRNFKIGISITGICQKLQQTLDWSDPIYRHLRAFDKEWSALNGYPESIRLTVIQPSGTKGLLSGATPGAHPGYAPYFIRRIRFASNDPLIKVLKEMNVPMEPELKFDGSTRHDVLVAEFPCKFESGTVCAKDMSAIDQLNLVKNLQAKWADQSVSVTVYYKEEELETIKDWLKENYDDHLKTISFLRHSDHGFKQAPYETISEEEYLKKVKKIKMPDSSKITSNEVLDGIECAGGVCPVR